MPDASEIRTARFLLVAVAVLYLVLQLALFSRSRPPSWDEAVYLSQVDASTTALSFAPSRARGIVVIAALAGTGRVDLAWVRTALAVASSVALAAALLPWTRIIGVAAPVAGFLLATSWTVLFYGTEVMPNLWTAFLGIAAAGWLARWALGAPDRGALIAVALLIGAMALLRPPDAAVCGIGLVLALAWLRTRCAPRQAIASAVLLGWLPWVIEMSVRFGSPWSALSDAANTAHASGSGLADGLAEHLRLIDGPTIGPQGAGGISLVGVAWVVILATATIVGMRSSGVAGRGARLAGVAASALLLEYVVLIDGFAPRFLLPALALFAVASGIGVRSLAWQRNPIAVLLPVATVLVAFAIWHVSVADRIEERSILARSELQQLGTALGGRATPDTCAFASQEGWPQIAYASGCRGWPLAPDGLDRLEALPDPSERFVIVRTGAHPDLDQARLRRARAPGVDDQLPPRPAVR